MLDLLSEKWVLLVLEQLGAGPVRFRELQRRVGSVSEKSLTQTLRHLEGRNVLTRTVFPAVPPHIEYALTEFGMALRVQVQELRHWADAHAEKLISSLTSPSIS